MMHTDAPWQDIVDALTTTDPLVQQQAIHSPTPEARAFTHETALRFPGSIQVLPDRAIEAGAVRPKVGKRHLVAVIIMTMATAHPSCPGGADRRRHLALLADGPRTSPTTPARKRR
ncbi:hypothetical protein ABZ490_23815 [Streptomyces sp. NPDC005811]|uniref:hypothetical protein n=1 Tax=Streptomyces sp. NPDC005811 TaxID=3154565 RepID=UPI0033EC9481